ncbi:sigma 54-interacting transcriptional regulator [Anaeromyxobacter oryzae]|uniref:Fis family transcriptional regulator n=1 Tax=Anaeromyxobacter oryzae TaxID=2918170 RepID=A0ABM7WZV2_9BACT|nr:sigma 54-interacting transcriptional regulator [Anaeromyxobacter oryzae]BDG05016.1 hypothetical protein AMOR_40120 [Anaeromyxobacter oryzae]
MHGVDTGSEFRTVVPVVPSHSGSVTPTDKFQRTLDRVTLRMAGALDLRAVLSEITRGLTEDLEAALARIWLIGAGDMCTHCALAAQCPERSRCLHLVASAGLSERLDGMYGRIPVGVLKVGAIAAAREAVCSNSLLEDARITDKAWVRREGLAAFAGYPLTFGDEVFGVLAMFARRALTDLEFEQIAVFAAQASAAIKNARLFERVSRMLQQLQTENAYLKEELRQGIAHSNIVVFQQDADLRYRWMYNPQSFMSEEVAGKTDAELFPPEVAARMAAAKRRVLESGQATHDELRVPRNGESTLFQIDLHPFRDAAGAVVGVTGVSTDITRETRVQQELAQALAFRVSSHPTLGGGETGIATLRVAERTAELAAANEELRRVTDAIPQAILVLAPDGSTVYVNAFVLAYTGLNLDEVKAEGSHEKIFHPDDLERAWHERQMGLSRGEPFETELRARRRDGQYRWFLVRYHPLRSESGEILRWYATATDIEDRRRTEERVRIENLALRDEIDHSNMFDEIVGSSEGLRRVLARLAKVAPTDSTVLIVGETGTGKELIARAIHKRSSRASRALIRVNCAAIPSSLVASELFGHEKGAFTGALQRRVGRFEAADGGTIFLDEVGDLPAETQVALLRVLQEREFERVGSSRPVSVDVRVLAATHRDLSAAVQAGTFREDLFFRLNVFPLEIPPLRERPDDIPLLVEYMIERYAKKAGKRIKSIEEDTLEMLRAYAWPGNVRELQNVVERAVILSDADTFVVDDSWLKRGASKASPPAASITGTLAANERELIEAALAACKGRVAGAAGAAVRLGIPRQTLDSRIRALHIDKYKYKTS